ncbi:MAG TPA: SurA N-terminal domain-containing protein [Candidatus Paceibacterota bacterium]|nr:SurA N-terminal domain-containing protein [Candidatus Paceibacterota bacterium]
MTLTNTEQQSEQKKPMPKKLIGVVMGVLVIGGAGYWAVSSGLLNLGSFQTGVPSGALVAKVNGEGIEKRLFDARFGQAKSNYEVQGIALEAADAEQLRQEVLDDMINKTLLAQYGIEQGIGAPDQAVEDSYRQIVTQFESEQELQDQLASQGITTEDVRSAISQELIVSQVAERQAADNNVQVSEEETRKVYDDAVAGGAEVPEFDGVKGEIEQYVRQQKIGQLLNALVERLRAEGTVEILS